MNQAPFQPVLFKLYSELTKENSCIFLKCFIGQFQLINVERMTGLKYHHFAAFNEIMDLGNDFLRPLEPLGQWFQYWMHIGIT